MKQKIAAFVGLCAVVFFVTSGLFEWFTKIFVWLITIDTMAPEISIVGQIFVKYSTWIITFSLVRIVFQLIGWYDSDAMKMVYFAISTLISFALSYVIMILEKYILWFALGFILVILLFIVIYIIQNKRDKEKTNLENQQ